MPSYFRLISEGRLHGTDACQNHFGFRWSGPIPVAEYFNHSITMSDWLDDMFTPIQGLLTVDFEIESFSVHEVNLVTGVQDLLYRDSYSFQGSAITDPLHNAVAATLWATASGYNRQARKNIGGIASINTNGNFLTAGAISALSTFGVQWQQGPDAFLGSPQEAVLLSFKTQTAYDLVNPVSVNSLLGTMNLRKVGRGS